MKNDTTNAHLNTRLERKVIQYGNFYDIGDLPSSVFILPEGITPEEGIRL